MLDSVFLDDLRIHESEGIALTEFDYNTPPVRSSLTTRPRRHGARDFTSLYQSRIFSIAGEVWGVDHANLWVLVDAFKSRLLPGVDHVLKWTKTGQTYAQQATVRPAGDFQFEMRSGAAFMTFSGTLVAGDPRIYAATLKSHQYDPTTVPGGGMSFPATYPLTYAAGSGVTEITAQNDGTFGTFPTFTVNGPATNPVIENITTTEKITTTATLASSSDSLWIDVAGREVRLGGSSGTLRPDLITVATTDWFDLDPGTSTIKLTGTGFTANQTFLLAEYRSAWI